MILIRAERVLGPAEGPDLKTDVVLDGDRTAGTPPTGQGGAEGASNFSPRERTYRQIVEAERLVAAPGLMDIHVHFRDPDPTYKENTYTGTGAATEDGFTTVVCMANTNPIVNSEGTLRHVLEGGEKTSIHTLSCVAVSEGFMDRELTDMEGLLTAGAAEFADDGIPLMDGAFVRAAMKEAARLDAVLSFHEEDKRFIRENGINHNRVSDELGIYGSPALAEDSLVARDCMIALDTGTTVDIQHISSEYSVEMARLTKRLEAKVQAEVIPHHFTLIEEAVLKHGTLVRMSPPLRTEKDRQILTGELKDGTADMIATSHTPHSREEEEWPLTQAPSGILGLKTTLILRITNLVKTGHLTLLELMEKMSLNPARLYRPDCRRAELEAPADSVLFDVDRQWTVEGFGSKSASNPLLGETLTGKVVYMVCGRKVAYGEQGTEV